MEKQPLVKIFTEMLGDLRSRSRIYVRLDNLLRRYDKFNQKMDMSHLYFKELPLESLKKINPKILDLSFNDMDMLPDL